jgi:3-oxoacyl-[acyl-carrier protein] reductase
MNIIITGASRGIGYQTCLNFSRKGNTVFAISRSEEGLKKLVNESGGKVIALPCNLSDENEIVRVSQRISSQVNSIELLINNAGMLIKKNIAELTVQEVRDIYAVNVFAPFALTKELLSLLRKGKLSDEIHSHVVNISSMGGVQGSMKFDGLSAYSSSKGALITLTECMSNEMRDMGVRMNCIALGSVDTEMFMTAFPGLKASSDMKGVSEWLAEFSQTGWRFFNGKTLPFSTTTP